MRELSLLTWNQFDVGGQDDVTLVESQNWVDEGHIVDHWQRDRDDFGSRDIFLENKFHYLIQFCVVDFSRGVKELNTLEFHPQFLVVTAYEQSEGQGAVEVDSHGFQSSFTAGVTRINGNVPKQIDCDAIWSNGAGGGSVNIDAHFKRFIGFSPSEVKRSAQLLIMTKQVN